MALSTIRKNLARFLPLLNAYLIATNYAYGLRGLLGRIGTSSGSRHSQIKDVGQSVGYVRGVFEDYSRHAGWKDGDLAGKSVLEIGPGDNLGVALLFLASGAERVACLDRFYSLRDERRQREIYLALRNSLSAAEREVFERVVRFSGEAVKFDGVSLTEHYGHGAEDADKVFAPESFDVIVSRSVLEHVADLDKTLYSLNSVLRPGGLMIHKVDFRDHGLFSAYGYHPLTFLTIPENRYAAMSRHAGRPNRRLYGDYRERLVALGFEVKIVVTHVLGGVGDLNPERAFDDPALEFPTKGRALLRQIHGHLDKRFYPMDEKELLVTGIFFTARKSR